MSLLRQNIDTRGRIIRGLGALVLGIGAALVWQHSRIAGIVLCGASAFVAFEAVRGWCALRACGLKTKF